MEKPSSNTARILLSILGVIFLIIGGIAFFIGLLLFLGIDVIGPLLPKSISTVLLPSNIGFISAVSMVFGVSALITSRLFHTSSKWLKKGEKKGGILAILLSVASLVILFVGVVSLNFTITGDILYLIILIYAAIIISVLLSWKDMNGGLEEVLPGLGSFIAAGFVIFLLIMILFSIFPTQSNSLSTVGSQSLFSIFTGSLGQSSFQSAAINYTYPNSLVNINLNGLFSSIRSLLSETNYSNISSSNVTNSLGNTNLNLLLPNSFIVSAIGNSPNFLPNIGKFNITQYLKQNSSSTARNYLEKYFPELDQLYLIITGKQTTNSSNNISILGLTPSKFEIYLKSMNIIGLNSSFPINATKYIYSSNSNKELDRYLPSQMFFINMSNHVGLQFIYNASRIFNITKIPFYSASMALYVQNSTTCFEFGVDFSKNTEKNFNLSSYFIEKTLKCS